MLKFSQAASLFIVGLSLFSNPAVAADAPSATLEQRVKTLEEQVAILMKGRPAIPSDTEGSVPATHDSQAPSTVVNDNDSGKVKVTKWDFASRDGSYGRKMYHISYSLLNSYEKPIKLIKGTLQFQDLLGEHIYGIQLDQDVRLSPGKESSFQGDYARNQFIPEQQRLAGMVKSDIVVKLLVTTVVFSDNTVVNLP